MTRKSKIQPQLKVKILVKHQIPQPVPLINLHKRAARRLRAKDLTKSI